MKKLSVYLTEIQHKELKVFCAEKKVSMSFFVNISIRDRIRKDIEKTNNRSTK